MRICPVSNLLSNRTRFTGVLIKKDEYSDSWDYKGEKSGSSIDGHYVGSQDIDYYTYFPFSDESEDKIREEIYKNSVVIDYTSLGMGGGYECIVTRGKTLPYSSKEWAKLSDVDQEKIKSLL